MSDPHELVSMLQELDEQMISCMKCGMCQAACPLYAQTGRETDVARGKIALVDSLARELLKDPQGVKERLDRCLLCGSCAASCPSGVRVLDIFLQARAIITGYLGLSPAKKIIFRGMLSRPKLFDSLMQLATKFQGLFTRPVNELLGSSCARFQSPLIGQRHFVPLAKQTWHKISGEIDSHGSGRLKVAFFPGCLVDKIYPRLGNTVLKLMEHFGIGVCQPGQLVCCGIPALSSGDRKSFEKLLSLNLQYYSSRQWDYLLTPCATCASTIRKIWPLMSNYFTESEKGKVKDIADRTMDLSEFLLLKNLLNNTRAKPESADRIITYHDPCHLKKSLGIFLQPRELIRQNTSYMLKEMDEADTCCGMGGSFNLQYYELSSKIGERKLNNILKVQPHVVATGCPACMMQITDLLSQKGEKIQVKHYLEIYAQSLGL